MRHGVSLLRDALALWRGNALADLVDEPFAGPEVVRLEQSRLAALEDRIEADLALGRHREISAELASLVADHPLRERLWGQFIVALYRSDRQADALAAYGRARNLLAEELGIDPGPALRDLERAVLQQDLDMAAPAPRLTSVPRPVRLPTPAGRTIGRDDEIQALREQLANDDHRLITLTGPGGSGKTRLAVGVAHAAAEDFAGGVYFVDLASLAEPQQVLPAIVRSLGAEERPGIPPGDVASDALADRDVLLVLDNFEHVLPAVADVAALLRSVARLRVVVDEPDPAAHR